MGSASAELGPVLGLDVESTGIGGTAEGHMVSAHLRATQPHSSGGGPRSGGRGCMSLGSGVGSNSPSKRRHTLCCRSLVCHCVTVSARGLLVYHMDPAPCSPDAEQGGGPGAVGLLLAGLSLLPLLF